MEIKVHDIPPEGMTLSFEEDPAGWGLAERGLTVEGTVRVLLKLAKHDQDDVYIRGSVSASVLLECSRCLKMFTHPIQSEFHVDYLPISLVPPGEERELGRGDLDLHFYKGEHIQVNEVIEGQLHLAIPMRPLCRPDCRGLCPHCGEDLNLKECPCPKEPIDSRLIGLKDFFKKKE